MSMLEALVRYHDRSVRTALSKEQLGIPGAARGGTLSTTLPAPEVAEFEGRTKDRHVLCVETSDAGLVGLLGPCSWGGGRKMTKDLVRAG
ncbi:hypothetical protein, partial [Starkeya nomas]|uniref:hypothetical protein n=1 Tax=Starkeya nomas TaxID=2666134 RepID=UPI001AED349B